MSKYISLTKEELSELVDWCEQEKIIINISFDFPVPI